MKKFIIFALITLSITLFASKQGMALIHSGLSIPINGSYNLKDSENFDKQSISGIGLSLVVPFGLMFRIDQFRVSTKYNDADVNANSLIASVGYRVGLPLLPFHFAATYGLGRAVFTDEFTIDDSFKNSSQSQIYFEAGYSLIPLFDFYIGYHIINGKKLVFVPVSGDEQTLDSELSGSIISIGVNFGF